MKSIFAGQKGRAVIEMKEIPILFSSEMVRAILDGRKTQTRRICKKEVTFDTGGEPFFFVTENPRDDDSFGKWVGMDEYHPHGSAGDKLWVRETWCPHGDYDSIKPSEITGCSKVYYRADKELDVSKWRPSIFMPRWASRITLEITDIRVERLQDISVEDIIAEGISTTLREHDACCHLKEQWIELWDSINANRAPWDSNPWVWVIEFKRVEQ